MRKRKISASEALALLNAAPKQQMNYGGRLTAREQVAEIEREERAKAQAELDRHLAPQIQEQARTLSQLRDKERRETRLQLMFSPSFDFDAPLWVPDGSTPDVITHNIGAALAKFRQSDEGLRLSDADLRLLKEFLQLNSQYKPFDLTNPQTWALAWEFIERKLNPVEPEQNETAPVATETEASAEPIRRDVYTQTWMADLAPIFREAVASLERSSGLVMQHPQMLELAAHFDKRSANSKRPIPMTVFELRKTAYQLWGNEIGPIHNDRSFLIDEDSQLSSEDLKRKYGFTHSYSNQMLTATEKTRN